MSIKRNTSYNIVGSLVPIAISVITIPPYLQILGEQRYGVLSTIWLLVGYFGFFDFGMGQATAQRLALARTQKTGDCSSILTSALTVGAIFGFVGAAVLVPVSIIVIDNFKNFDLALKTEVHESLPTLSLLLATAILQPTLRGAFQAYEKFLPLNIIVSANNILFQVIPLSVAYIEGPALQNVLLAAAIVRALNLILLLYYAKRLLLPGRWLKPRRTEFIELLHFGGWTTVSAIISPIMEVSDRIIIGNIAGASSVAHYNVAYQLSRRTTLLSSAVASSTLPRYTIADDNELERLTKRSVEILCSLLTPSLIFGTLISRPFFSYWISPNFADNVYNAFQVLLFSFWINSVASVPFVRLQALGKPKIIALCHALELLPFLALLYMLLPNYGILGAAIALAGRNLLDLLVLSRAAKILALVTSSIASQFLLLFLTVSVELKGWSDMHSIGVGCLCASLVISLFRERSANSVLWFKRS